MKAPRLGTHFFQINRVYKICNCLNCNYHVLPRSHLHLKFLFQQFTSSSLMINENDDDNSNNTNNSDDNNNEKEGEC